MPDATPLSRLRRRFAVVISVVALGLTGPLARAADPQPYTVSIDGTGQAPLDAAITDSSTLVSLREKAPVGPFALVARAREDADRFQAALESFGYYKGRAEVRIGDRALDDPDLPDYLGDLPAEPPAPVTVSVQAGPLFHLRQVAIEGPVPYQAREKLGLDEGAPAVAADVLAARARLLGALRAQGYALAKVSDPVAILEPGDDALDVTYVVDTGPLVDLGDIGVQGLAEMNESFVRQRLLIHPGDRFDPGAVEKARQDLASLGVFSSVRAVAAETLDPQGRLPVEFVVVERKRHAVSLGAAYSTDLGASLTATWQDRNLFGNAEQLNLTAGYQAGGTAQTTPGYSAGAQFIKPDFLQRDQSLQIDLAPVKESVLAYDRTAVAGGVLVKRKLSERWTGSIGVASEQERVTQQGTRQDYTLAGVPVSVRYDSTNDPFDPTEGLRATLSATPTRSLGTPSAAFVLLQASGSTYLDLGARFGGDPRRSVLALRGLIGDIEGASQLEVPPDRRFYAGGSGTVRGYKYQSVGPLFPDDQPEGGTAVVAGTVELRQRIGGDYGAVAFVDAGQVSPDGGSFPGPWGVGAGIGARYYTSIGPIRVDVAVPLNKVPGGGSFELYIGIGQAF